MDLQQIPLSRGCLARVNGNGPDATKEQVILQVIDLKLLANKTGTAKRYRATVNDGVNTSSMMLASQLVALADDEHIKPGSIIRVLEFMANNINHKRVIIMLNAEPLTQYGILPVISYVGSGTPPPIGDSGPDGSAGGVPPQQHQPQQQQPGFGAPPGGGYGAPPGGVAPGNGFGGGGFMAQPALKNEGPPHPMGGAPPFQPAPAPVNGGGQTGGGFAAAPAGGYGGGGAGGGAYGGGGGAQSGGAYGASSMGGYGGGAAYGGGGGGGRGGGRGFASNYGGAGPIARDSAPPKLVPISSLNPYSARWTIRARVTSKGEVRRWNKPSGEGKLFSFDVLDKDGGDIRVTGFGGEVDKFFDLVQVGKVYQISKAGLKQKKPQFNNTSHQYEINLERDSQIELVQEDEETAAIPAIIYNNLKRIDELESMEAGSFMDVVGIVESCQPSMTITKKNGTETIKRAMVLRDDSNRSIELTLWDAHVHDPGEAIEQATRSGTHPVLAVKNARIGDFNGKTLSSCSNTTLRIDPQDIPQTNHLHNWYAQQGNAQVIALSSGGGGGGGGARDKRVTFGSFKDEALGSGEKPDWVTVSGTINFIQTSTDRPVYYAACPLQSNGRPCNKKMQEDDPGVLWSCSRCNESTNQPAWRYLLQLSACDHKAVQWMTAFAEAGELLFGRPADQMRQLMLERYDDYEAVLTEANMTPVILRLKVAQETYQDEQKIKASINNVTRITDFPKECRLMLDLIGKMEAGIPVLRHREEHTAQQSFPGMSPGNRGPQASRNPYTSGVGSTHNGTAAYPPANGNYNSGGMGGPGPSTSYQGQPPQGSWTGGGGMGGPTQQPYGQQTGQYGGGGMGAGIAGTSVQQQQQYGAPPHFPNLNGLSPQQQQAQPQHPYNGPAAVPYNGGGPPQQMQQQQPGYAGYGGAPPPQPQQQQYGGYVPPQGTGAPTQQGNQNGAPQHLPYNPQAFLY